MKLGKFHAGLAGGRRRGQGFVAEAASVAVARAEAASRGATEGRSGGRLSANLEDADFTRPANLARQSPRDLGWGGGGATFWARPLALKQFSIAVGGWVAGGSEPWKLSAVVDGRAFPPSYCTFNPGLQLLKLRDCWREQNPLTQSCRMAFIGRLRVPSRASLFLATLLCHRCLHGCFLPQLPSLA